MSKTARRKSYLKRRKSLEKFCSSRKVGYVSKLDADIAMLRLNSSKSPKDKELSKTYLCDECGSWHLTSKVTALSGNRYCN